MIKRKAPKARRRLTMIKRKAPKARRRLTMIKRKAPKARRFVSLTITKLPKPALTCTVAKKNVDVAMKTLTKVKLDYKLAKDVENVTKNASVAARTIYLSTSTAYESVSRIRRKVCGRIPNPACYAAKKVEKSANKIRLSSKAAHIAAGTAYKNAIRVTKTVKVNVVIAEKGLTTSKSIKKNLCGN